MFECHGYKYEIKLETFGNEKFPVIHAYSEHTVLGREFDFPIILSDYKPKYPDSDEVNNSDRVTVDFALIDKTFHAEVKKFYEDMSKRRK